MDENKIMNITQEEENKMDANEIDVKEEEENKMDRNGVDVTKENRNKVAEEKIGVMGKDKNKTGVIEKQTEEVVQKEEHDNFCLILR